MIKRWLARSCSSIFGRHGAAPCKHEIPLLESIYLEHKNKDFVVLGVSVDDELKSALKFMKKTKISFPVVHDKKRQVAGRYKPTKMPSSYLIDRSGKVVMVHSGFQASDAKEIRAAVAAALK